MTGAPSVDRLFLDANVLFSAAYRADAGLRALWALARTQLVTSAYAVVEARRNLATPLQQQALDELLATIEVIGQQAVEPKLPRGIHLPDKDQPILRGAIGAGCTHLITGDLRHFGTLYGQRVGGVLILRPAAYLARRG